MKDNGKQEDINKLREKVEKGGKEKHVSGMTTVLRAVTNQW